MRKLAPQKSLGQHPPIIISSLLPPSEPFFPPLRSYRDSRIKQVSHTHLIFSRTISHPVTQPTVPYQSPACFTTHSERLSSPFSPSCRSSSEALPQPSPGAPAPHYPHTHPRRTGTRAPHGHLSSGTPAPHGHPSPGTPAPYTHPRTQPQSTAMPPQHHLQAQALSPAPLLAHGWVIAWEINART